MPTFFSNPINWTILTRRILCKTFLKLQQTQIFLIKIPAIALNKNNELNFNKKKSFQYVELFEMQKKARLHKIAILMQRKFPNRIYYSLLFLNPSSNHMD